MEIDEYYDRNVECALVCLLSFYKSTRASCMWEGCGAKQDVNAWRRGIQFATVVITKSHVSEEGRHERMTYGNNVAEGTTCLFADSEVLICLRNKRASKRRCLRTCSGARAGDLLDETTWNLSSCEAQVAQRCVFDCKNDSRKSLCSRFGALLAYYCLLSVMFMEYCAWPCALPSAENIRAQVYDSPAKS
jgi:hypothetical protein